MYFSGALVIRVPKLNIGFNPKGFSFGGGGIFKVVFLVVMGVVIFNVDIFGVVIFNVAVVVVGVIFSVDVFGEVIFSVVGAVVLVVIFEVVVVTLNRFVECILMVVGVVVVIGSSLSMSNKVDDLLVVWLRSCFADLTVVLELSKQPSM